MSRAVEQRIYRQVDEAERRGSCYVASSERDARVIRRRPGGLISPAPSVYVRESLWRELSPSQRAMHLMRAFGELRPAWVFCGPSAAVAHGLYVSFSDVMFDGKPLLHIFGRGRPRAYDGCVIRFRQFQAAHRSIELAREVRVTDAASTAIECACSLPFERALACMDSLLRFHDVDKAGVLGVMHGLGPGVRGVRTARLALEYADSRSESGGESLARAFIIEEGFVVPELQQVVVDDVSGRTYRPDFMWTTDDGRTIYGELDGMEKFASEEMRGGRPVHEVARAERLRESHLTVHGAKVLRITPSMLRDRDALVRVFELYGVPRAR